MDSRLRGNDDFLHAHQPWIVLQFHSLVSYFYECTFYQNPPPKTVNHRVHREILCVYRTL